MRVDRLALVSFRSYPSLEARFGPGAHVVYGANAAGKTNLLEAIALLGVGGSHRADADAEMIAWGTDFARLEADVAAGPRVRRTSRSSSRAAVRPARASASASTAWRRRAAQLAQTLPVVLFAPEDMLLIVGSPSLRRHALDALIVRTVPTAAATMATYARALSQRNNLLKSHPRWRRRPGRAALLERHRRPRRAARS